MEESPPCFNLCFLPLTMIDFMAYPKIHTYGQVMQTNPIVWTQHIMLLNFYTVVMYWFLSVKRRPWFWMWAQAQVLALQNSFWNDKGRWAIEVADEFSKTQVIGIDLAPIQPTFLPLNCEFIVGDLNTNLADYNDGSVDLVHARFNLLILNWW